MAGNSWQQPVAGEPSWGTPHTHLETIVDNADPSGTGDTTVTCTNVPTGTKGIFGYARVYSTGGARYMYIKDASANVWLVLQSPSVNINAYGFFFVPLDSNKQFKYSVSNSDVSIAAIVMGGYFI